MSSLDVQTIENVATVKSNSSAPPAFQNSSGAQVGTLCRAWVNYNGISNSINAAFNVSSVTDDGTGIFTVNFANELTTSNYASCFTAQNGSRGVCCNIAGSTAGGTPTQKNTLGVQMSIRIEGSGALTDCTEVSVSVFY